MQPLQQEQPHIVIDARCYKDIQIEQIRDGKPYPLIQDPSGVKISLLEMIQRWGESPLGEEWFDEVEYPISISVADTEQTISLYAVQYSDQAPLWNTYAYTIEGFTVTIQTRDTNIEAITITPPIESFGK